MAAKKNQQSPEPKDEGIERKKYTDIQRVRLDDDELIERAQEQSRHLQTIEEMEAELKTKVGHAKAAIQERAADVKRLAIEIRDRATYRPVDCERIFDYRRGIVTEVRLDTGEQISERPMTYAEKQRELPLGGPPKDEEIDEDSGDDPADGEGKLEADADQEGGRMGGRRRRGSGRAARA